MCTPVVTRELGDSWSRPLAGPELFTWMALRRANGGGVARFEGNYYDFGRRVPCFLPGVFDELVDAGLLTFADLDPNIPGWRRAALTCTGRVRFAVLSERERRPRIPGRTVKHNKSKASRGLVTRRIVYLDRKHPHHRPSELKVDVSLGEVLDAEYAAAMVAVRTILPLADVKIVKITE